MIFGDFITNTTEYGVLVLPSENEGGETLVIGPARAVQAELLRRHLQPLRVCMPPAAFRAWVADLRSDPAALAEYSERGTVHGIATELDEELDAGVLFVAAADPLGDFSIQLRRRLGKYLA